MELVLVFLGAVALGLVMNYFLRANQSVAAGWLSKARRLLEGEPGREFVTSLGGAGAELLRAGAPAPDFRLYPAAGEPLDPPLFPALEEGLTAVARAGIDSFVSSCNENARF